MRVHLEQRTRTRGGAEGVKIARLSAPSALLWHLVSNHTAGFMGLFPLFVGK